MRWPRLPPWLEERPWLLFALSAGSLYASALILFPEEGAAPPATPSAKGLSRMSSDPLVAVPGRTYKVTLVTHGAANAASEASIISKAQSMGFGNISPSKSRPADWPSGAVGDWYVVATFQGKTQITIPRKNGSFLAGVDVVDAWEEP